MSDPAWQTKKREEDVKKFVDLFLTVLLLAGVFAIMAAVLTAIIVLAHLTGMVASAILGLHWGFRSEGAEFIGIGALTVLAFLGSLIHWWWKRRRHKQQSDRR